MCEVKELPETYQPLTPLVVCIFYSLCSLIWRTPRIFLWVPFVILPTLVGLPLLSKVQEENKSVTLFCVKVLVVRGIWRQATRIVYRTLYSVSYAEKLEGRIQKV